VIAAGLACYAVLLLAAGVPALARAAWPGRAPQLAIFAWLALAGSSAASVALGGLALTVPTTQVSSGLGALLEACDDALRARYAHPGGAALAGAGVVLAAVVVGRLVWCTAATLVADARTGRRHRRGLRLTGRADARLGAVVVDHGEPAAYCLPGAGRPVVVTTAALRALDEAQLAAVLAHERAHQAGRHHLLVSLGAAFAAAFPWMPAFRIVRDEVARLAELAADDAAAACSPRLAVAEALLTLGAAPAGAAVLGAGGSSAAARVRRLIAAPNPLGRRATAGWALAVTALAASPLILLLGPAVVLATGQCPIPH
jgi:Zn-dependent protease with chaperone function